MLSKKGKLKKAFSKFEQNLQNNFLVEKTWEEFFTEIVNELQCQSEERSCDNYQIFDIVEENYDVHIVVADSVFNMYILYVKVLRQNNEAKSS